jgi:hypothetical protein
MENLVLISSSKSVNSRSDPWVRTVSLRREFLMHCLTIREAEPFALFDMHDHLYLIAGASLKNSDGSIPSPITAVIHTKRRPKAKAQLRSDERSGVIFRSAILK